MTAQSFTQMSYTGHHGEHGRTESSPEYGMAAAVDLPRLLRLTRRRHRKGIAFLLRVQVS